MTDELEDDFSTLSPNLQEKARLECNEDQDNRLYSIQKVREFIEENDEFDGRTDASFILRYLRVSKFDHEKTTARMTRYYHVRDTCSKWFDWSDENEAFALQIVQSRLCYSMNYEGGCQENVIIFEAGNYSSKLFSVDQLAIAVTLLVEVLLEDSRFQIGGIQLVINFRGVGMDLISQLTPRFLWRFISCWQFTMPIRIKGIHVMNANSFLNNVMYLVKAFLTKKLKSRFFIHKSDSTSLFDSIPVECVPSELSGTAGTAQLYVDSTNEVLLRGKEFYKQNQRYGMIT